MRDLTQKEISISHAETSRLIWLCLCAFLALGSLLPANTGIDSTSTPNHAQAVEYVWTYMQEPDPAGIHWMSFPVVDDKTSHDGVNWNSLGYIFNEHLMFAPFSALLDEIRWSYGGSHGRMMFMGDSWIFVDYAVTPAKGFKVKYFPGGQGDPIHVRGYKADPDSTPVRWVVGVGDFGQARPFENWIGYFVPFTQKAADALSRLIPDADGKTYLDYVHKIQTRTWSTSRLAAEPGSPWIIDPNRFTLSEGDMLVLMLLAGAPKEMYWSTEGIQVPPAGKTPASAFQYDEKLDYSSVFIEFDPQDIPKEVGIFVDGACKGAAVVDNNLVDLCFYRDHAMRDAELQIMFHYEDGSSRIADNWKRYNPDSMLFEDAKIQVGQIGSYAYLSFNRRVEDSPIPLVTELLPFYPNPFNPSTTISFVLSGDMIARLDIYNVQGQKVKTLVYAPLGKGKHTLEWNGKDDNGRPVSSGIYFSRLNTADGNFVNKMMLMK